MRVKIFADEMVDLGHADVSAESVLETEINSWLARMEGRDIFPAPHAVLTDGQRDLFIVFTYEEPEEDEEQEE